MQSYMQKKFKDGCVSRLAANMAGFITWYGDRTKISSVCVRRYPLSACEDILDSMRGYPQRFMRISSRPREDILVFRYVYSSACKRRQQPCQRRLCVSRS